MHQNFKNYRNIRRKFSLQHNFEIIQNEIKIFMGTGINLKNQKKKFKFA